MEPIYLDANATTPLLPAVWEAMLPYWMDRPGNPASSHRFGRQARQALESARESIAYHLGAQPDEVIFTSGATEANNLALFGLAGKIPGRFVRSAIEHPCVVEPGRQLAEAGWMVETLPVSQDGIVSLPAEFPRPDTRLVSVMLANHETGAVQPVGQVAARLGGLALLHCDAAAAVGKMVISFADLGVAALTISAHKFHGPKGIGALVLERRTTLQPRLWGGHQQQGRRPGTEAVALAVGMARALELAVEELPARTRHVEQCRHAMVEGLRAQAAPIVINGPESGGLPHTLNVSFPGCQADLLLMNLDLAGIACSTGSACSSGSLLPSPVLEAMGVAKEVLQSALRFSFSPMLALNQVMRSVEIIAQVVKKLRQSSGWANG